MTVIKLRYIDRFKDRHGVERLYYRRGRSGKRVPLRGQPGSAEFMADYDAALAGEKPSRVVKKRPRGAPGTFDALLEAYFRAVLPTQKPITRKNTRNILERLILDEGWGHRPVATLPREKVELMLSKRADKPGAAHAALRKLRTLVRWAIATQPPWIKIDPTAGIKVPKLGTHHTWTDWEIAAYEERWRLGTRERTAFALLFYTGQRIADVAKMSWRDIETDADGFQSIWVVQSKGGKRLLIPLHPELAAALAHWPRKHFVLLPTIRGKPIPPDQLSRQLGRYIEAAGLEERCVAHGLRKAAARTLAEVGCSAKVIASITGHSSLEEVKRHTEAADQKRLARQGIEAWWAKAKTGTSVPNLNENIPTRPEKSSNSTRF
jgi:enterobacteria phage integrase